LSLLKFQPSYIVEGIFKLPNIFIDRKEKDEFHLYDLVGRKLRTN